MRGPISVPEHEPQLPRGVRPWMKPKVLNGKVSVVVIATRSSSPNTWRATAASWNTGSPVSRGSTDVRSSIGSVAWRMISLSSGSGAVRVSEPSRERVTVPKDFSTSGVPSGAARVASPSSRLGGDSGVDG